MPADWSLPTLTTLYTLVLDYLKARDEDSGTMCINDPTNKPVGMFRYVRSLDVFQEWNGSAWVNKIISILGGGTGATTVGSARTNLGLGDMATQTSSGVSITGGTIAGNGAGLTSLNAGNLATGTVPTARLGSGTANSTTFLRGDNTWQIITFDIPYAADKSTDFSAVVNTYYNVTATLNVFLPSVVGQNGKIIGLVMKNAGTFANVWPSGSETLIGHNPFFTWDWAQYSSLILKADANGLKWDII